MHIALPKRLYKLRPPSLGSIAEKKTYQKIKNPRMAIRMVIAPCKIFTLQECSPFLKPYTLLIQVVGVALITLGYGRSEPLAQ